MSLKSRLVAAASVFMLFTSGCATTQQNQPTQGGGSSTVEELPNEGGGQQGAAQAAPAGPQLNTFGTPADGFTAKMPGTPPVARNTVTTKAGDITTAAWSINDNGVIYSLSTADYPEKVVTARPPEALLDEGRDGLVTQIKGTLKSEENITINGTYPGKAFVISSDSGEVKARNYLVGKRLYTLLVLYNPSIGAPGADGFLTSLNLINPPPPLEHKGSTSGTTGTETPGTGTTEGTTAPGTTGSGTTAPGTTGSGTTAPGTTGSGTTAPGTTGGDKNPADPGTK